jgi:hypothetical protein
MTRKLASYTVIASKAKQSTRQQSKSGLLRRFAPRNDDYQQAIQRYCSNAAFRRLSWGTSGLPIGARSVAGV